VNAEGKCENNDYFHFFSFSFLLEVLRCQRKGNTAELMISLFFLSYAETDLSKIPLLFFIILFLRFVGLGWAGLRSINMKFTLRLRVVRLTIEVYVMVGAVVSTLHCHLYQTCTLSNSYFTSFFLLFSF
jgi:hypothetical protein